MVGRTLGRAGEKSVRTAMSSGALSAEVMCRRTVGMRSLRVKSGQAVSDRRRAAVNGQDRALDVVGLRAG